MKTKGVRFATADSVENETILPNSSRYRFFELVETTYNPAWFA